MTSDPDGGPWQAACRRQAAARPRESSSALCVALPRNDRCLIQNLIENLSLVTVQGSRPASYSRKGVKDGPYKVDGSALVSRRRVPRRSLSASSWECTAKEYRPGRWAELCGKQNSRSFEEQPRRGKEEIAQETANTATGPAALLASPRERQPFGEPLTSDPHDGPWQAAACQRQAAARPRKSSSVLRVALPQRNRSRFLAKAVPCDRQSSARLSPSTGPVALGNALPRTFRENSPRQSTTRHRGPAIDFIRTSFYTLPGIARWPMPLQGYRAEVFEEICEEASVVLAESEARGASKSRLAKAKRQWPKRRQTKRPARLLSWHCQESISPSVSR